MSRLRVRHIRWLRRCCCQLPRRHRHILLQYNRALQHGFNPAGPLPAGCTTSTPMTPVNPDTGGSSVDATGNWLCPILPHHTTNRGQRIRARSQHSARPGWTLPSTITLIPLMDFRSGSPRKLMGKRQRADGMLQDRVPGVAIFLENPASNQLSCRILQFCGHTCTQR